MKDGKSEKGVKVLGIQYRMEEDEHFSSMEESEAFKVCEMREFDGGVRTMSCGGVS